jgi:predicted amino acid-binding ACT domain protein
MMPPMNHHTKAPGQRFVVSVLVPDRVGILREITAAVSHLEGVIDGISQTVSDRYFTVLLTALFPESASAGTIAREIQAHFASGEADVIVRPCPPPATLSSSSRRERYMIILAGANHRDILRTVTTFLAERRINIEDWQVLRQEDTFTHIGEVTVPEALDIKQVQTDLQHALVPFHLETHVQHENIFRATNDIGPIKNLLTEVTP